MIISHSRKFIFIHLEKCGGTSIESAIAPYLKWDDLIIGSTNFGESLQYLYFNNYGESNVKKTMLWKHSNAQQIFDYLGKDRWDEYYKLAIVRDPIDLVKSFFWFSETLIKFHVGRINKNTWVDRIARNDWPSDFPYSEPYVRSLIKSKVDGFGFDGFSKYFLNSNSECSRTQYDRLTINGGKLEINDVIDLTQLESSWHNIVYKLKIPDAVGLPRLNISDKVTPIELTSKTESSIKKHYKKDYKNFY